MEEYRKFGCQKKQNTIINLPTISGNQNYSKQIISSENAFKLCRAGTKKEHFINFDLRTDDDVNLKHYRTPRSNILIPLLRYKQNKFSPMKEKSMLKKHGLLISRVKNNIATPCFADYDTSNLCDMKYQKQKKFIIPNAERTLSFEVQKLK